MADRPLVYIEWLDHCADGSWTDVETFHGPATVHTIGWLFKEDRKGLTVAACVSPNRDASHATSNLQFILRSCIVYRQVVELPKRKK